MSIVRNFRMALPVLVVGAACLAARGGRLGTSAWADEPAGLKFSKRCLMINSNEGCAVGDVNRDGKLDVVSGTHWYAGPDFIPRPVRDIPQITLGFGMNDFFANNGDFLHDVDGDGWLDVISGGWSEAELNWYKNPGKDALAMGWKWEPHLLVKARAENEAFHLTDLDGDGVPEIVVHCWVPKDPLVAWKLMKTTDGKPTATRHVIGEGGCGHGYGLGDVNGDGHTDILCGRGWYAHPGRDVFVKPWRFHPETALPFASAPFVVADVNGDGRNDLVWGRGHDYGLFWWEQGPPKPDGATTWKEHTIDKSWSQAHSLAWADLDGDGAAELIAGKRVRGHSGKDPGVWDPTCLYYYKWNGKDQFVRYPISQPGDGVGTGMQICVADLNQDGRPDIAVSGKSGTWLLFNEGKK